MDQRGRKISASRGAPMVNVTLLCICTLYRCCEFHANFCWSFIKIFPSLSYSLFGSVIKILLSILLSNYFRVSNRYMQQVMELTG